MACKPKTLLMADVTFIVRAEQDHIPVRGNALASGDAQADRMEENRILQRLREGDVWAWACVEVRGVYGSLNLHTDGRNFKKEEREEMLDALIYRRIDELMDEK